MAIFPWPIMMAIMAGHRPGTTAFASITATTARVSGITIDVTLVITNNMAITDMGNADTISVARMAITVTGIPGTENIEVDINAMTDMTATKDVTAADIGVSPGHASVILHGLDRCNPLAGYTGYISNHRPGTVLPIEQEKNRQLENFFIEWEERAFYIAYAALWDRESALDAVQEGMTRLVEYYRDKPEKEWPALFRTILNSKINDIRRRRMIEQGKHKLVSLTGLFQKDDAAASKEYELPAIERNDDISAPEAELVAGELRNRISEALQSLSERQRQVFILREWRGMTIREAARTLGCSENSVKQHHFRALRTLRVQLAEVWDHAQPTTS